ncbi:MAG: twin-arginine translocation signal domain-containing protein, partial [Pseudomonadota bacterium]
MPTKTSHKAPSPTRRRVLQGAGATAGAVLFAPYVNRAWASTTEINILSWYGLGEPDMVAEFEAANNVKFKPKYYAGGDNMLAALAQSPAGTFDLIHTDA